MQSQAAALSQPQRLLVAEYMTGKEITDTATASAPMCDQKNIDLSLPPKVSGWGINLGNNRYFGEQLTDITLSDMPALELAWAFAFPDASRVRSQPTVAGDSLFIGSQTGDVMAIDRSTGCVRWTFTTVAEVR